MPLYDFGCPDCGERFESRAGFDDPPPNCPACGAGHTERVVTRFAMGNMIRPRGRDARRLDADRAAKESQRLERKANRAEQRKQDS